jgi:predicted neutral ceramidase superfamily lipid hydrolase
MKKKVAISLLRHRDERSRRRSILMYAVGLVFLFLAHTYFAKLSTPLKLIPQTITAVSMGYVVLLIMSLRQFKYVAEFIDWRKVTEIAEQAGASNGDKPSI